MLHPVWPSLDFWSIIWIISTLPWFLSSTQLGFVKKSTGLVAFFLWLAIMFSSFLGTFVLFMLHISLRADPAGTDRLFRGYERAGKTIGSTLLLFGNVGLHYYSEKSVACMLTFLFLAFYCLCAVLCLQPCTVFGVMEFLLGASLSQALSLFGRGFYTWLVLTVCIVVMGVRYCLEPDQSPRIAASSSGAVGQNLAAMEEGRNWEAANLSPEVSLLHHEQRQGEVDDDREQERNLHRSGSAPTSTVEASLNEVGNLSEEMLRTDPANLSYYHPTQQLPDLEPLRLRVLNTLTPLQQQQLLRQPQQQLQLPQPLQSKEN